MMLTLNLYVSVYLLLLSHDFKSVTFENLLDLSDNLNKFSQVKNSLL